MSAFNYRIKKPLFRLTIWQYSKAVIPVTVVAFLSAPISEALGYYTVPFIFLILVSFLAATMSLGPVLLASTLSALIWNYFFIPPSNTFHIEKPEDLLMFAMFFIIALVNGVLTAKVRQQEKLAREREKNTDALFRLTRDLSGARNLQEVLTTATEKIETYFGIEVSFILQDGNGKLMFSNETSTTFILNEVERDIAEDFFKSKQYDATTCRIVEGRYKICMLSGATLKPGLAVLLADNDVKKTQKALWETFLTQISNSFERAFLVEMAHKASVLDESGRLYKTIFNSVSHEFRIPVATIIAASDALLSNLNSKELHGELCTEILTASIRLNRLIGNLLNMSRLESGLLVLRADWHDLSDLLNKVCTELKDELKNYTVITDIPDDLPLAYFDYGLLEQALYNILVNATQHTPESTRIQLNVSFEDSGPKITIKDNGPGFPNDTLAYIFDKFYRNPDHKPGHSGLGLSIAKGFVEAHKGHILVSNGKEGGAEFVITFPSERTYVTSIENF